MTAPQIAAEDEAKRAKAATVFTSHQGAPAHAPTKPPATGGNGNGKA